LTKTGADTATLRGHKDEVISLTFSKNSKYLASGSGNADNILRIWDVSTKQEVTILTCHTAGIWGLTFSSNGQMLASGNRAKTIKLWRFISLITHNQYKYV
jgi:WD40 repeat protein